MVGQYIIYHKKSKLTFCYSVLKRQIFLTSKQDPDISIPLSLLFGELLLESPNKLISIQLISHNSSFIL
jgi:hypothetical protein